MHDTALYYGSLFFKTYVNSEKSTKILDLGSQDVNGSLRTFASKTAEYIGVDVVDGKGVDVKVTDPYKLPFEDNFFDAAVSSSCFEHTEFFWLSFLELLRVLKPEGLLYINAPSNGSFHRYPVDCWRFYPDSGIALVNWAHRNGLKETALLESFVGDQKNDKWNDFVAVFIKSKKHISAYKKRMTSSFSFGFSNAYLIGSEEVLNFKDQSFDQLLINKQKEEIHNLSSSLAQRTKETEQQAKTINTLNQTLTNKNNEIKKIINSRSFIITKPFRFLGRVLRGEFSLAFDFLTRIKFDFFSKKKKYKEIILEETSQLNSSEITKNVAVHVHIYYEDAADTIVDYLKNIPFKFHLYITTDTKNKSKIINKHFETLLNIKSKKIFITPNRGRNVAPLLVTVGKYLISHDIALHIHSKKSLHSFSLERWFEYLFEKLLGSSEKIISIMNQFSLNKNLGILFPQPFHEHKKHLGIGRNLSRMKELLKRDGRKNIESVDQSFFPAGFMFWCRGLAIKPLVDMNLVYEDFETENGQIDGCLQHAIERLLPILAECNHLDTKQYNFSNNFINNFRDYTTFDFPKEKKFKEQANLKITQFTKQTNLTQQLASIIMPTYNRNNTICRAINSVLAQNYKNFELIIVDDGSEDGTEKTIKETFKFENRIKYFKFEKNIGASHARNYALDKSNGDYIFFLDSDNEWRSDFLHIMLNYMVINNLDAAYSAIAFTENFKHYNKFSEKEFDLGELLKKNFIDLNCFACKKRKNIYFDTSIERLVDWDFIISIVLDRKVEYLPFIGVNYYNGSDFNRITKTKYQNIEQFNELVRYIQNKHSKKIIHKNDQLYSGSIFFYPDYRITNPYQDLMYKNISKLYKIIPGSINDALTAQLSNNNSIIFHLHWTSILVGGNNENKVIQNIKDFINDINKFKSNGGKFVYTVHNLYSHDTLFKNLEKTLIKQIVLLSDYIHFHTLQSVKNFEDCFDIVVDSDKIVILNHGNYLTSYKNYLTKKEARHILKINNKDFVFLFIGQIREYKNLSLLILTFQKLIEKNSSKEIKLIIAGKPVNFDIRNLNIKKNSKIMTDFKFVADNDLQIYLNSADFMVMSHDIFLNSGSLFLSLSFGLPVIAPDLNIIKEILDDNVDSLLYKNSNDLLSKMENCLNMSDQTLVTFKNNALNKAKKFSWDNMSSKLEKIFIKSINADFNYINYKFFTDKNKFRQIIINQKDLEFKLNNKLGIIVLHYQNISDTINCVNSIRKQSNLDFKIFIISNDESIDNYVELAKKFPECIVIQSPSNLGYSGGNNIGLDMCVRFNIDYSLIVNPDIFIENLTVISELFKFIKKEPETMAVGTRIMFGHDKKKIWYNGSKIDFNGGLKIEHEDMGKAIGNIKLEAKETDYVCGAFFLINNKAIDIAGLLPEDYFLYFDETDYCTLLKRKGYKLKILSNLEVFHNKRSENNGIPTLDFLYYYCKSAILFSKKFNILNLSECINDIKLKSNIWLAKIKKKDPASYAKARDVVSKAINDGINNCYGKQNFLNE